MKIFRLILICAAVSVQFGLHAQFSPVAAGFTQTADVKVAWGDYDNDNDLDAAVYGDTASSSTNILIFYKNNGGVFSRDTSFVISAPAEFSIEWGDYNNDNYPDLLVGGTSLRIFIYNGSTFSYIHPLGPSFYPVSDLHWGDFNNDGRDDILYQNVVYYNSPNGFIRGQSQPVYFDYAASAVADYDEDGDLDFIITGDTAYPSNVSFTAIYRNNGDSTFTMLSPGISGAWRGDIAWSDYDQDGDLDIAVCGNNTNSVYIFKIYQNNAGVFTDINAGLTPVTWASIAWGDYNDDGFPDLAYCGQTASSGYEAKVLINNNGTSFTDAGAGLANLASGNLAWGDYDNDGDLDVLAAGQVGTGKFTAVYINNYNIPDSPPTAPSGLSSVTTVNNVRLNWMNASDAENATTSLTYNVYVRSAAFNVSPLSDTATGWRKIPASGKQGQTNSATVIKLPCGFYSWKVQAVDAGYAGSAFSQPDTFSVNYPLEPMLVSPANHSIGHPLNLTLTWNAPAGATTFHVQVATDTLFQNLVIDDSLLGPTSYNAAGLNFLTNYYWRVRANHGSYIGAWSEGWTFQTKDNVDVVEISSSLLPMSNGCITWVDFDNDNDLDIVSAGDTVGPTGFRKIKFYKNTNGTFLEYPQPALPGSLLFTPEIDFADIDRDGDLDLALQTPANQNGRIVLYINNNGNFTPSPQVFPDIHMGDISWDDYDHDGDPDLLAVGSNYSLQSVTKLFNNQNGVFSESGFQFANFSYADAHWADIDNDGYDDIIFTGDTNAQSGYRVTRFYKNNNGTSFTLSPTNLQSFYFTNGTYATADAGGASWADFDGDGDIDLVASGDTIPTNAFLPYQSVRIYKNNGGVMQLYQVLTDSLRGNVRWGDINNDGKPDIVISGSRFTYSGFRIAIWLNTGSGFIPYAPLLPDVAKGDVGLGDYDNDNDLDIAVMGADSITAHLSTLLFRNDISIPNTPPSPPAALSHYPAGSGVLLSWNPGSDPETPQAGLSYSVVIGSSRGAFDIMSPASDLQTGWRRTSTIGNAGYNTSYRANNFIQGWYYWQVQSVDASYIGSSFSPIDSFYINVPEIPVLISPANDSAEVPLQMRFAWMQADSALSYQLEIAEDSLFNQVLFNSTTLTDTFYNWQALAFFTKYFWRVRAQNTNGISNWSATWDFNSRSQFDRLANLGGGYGASFADYDSDGDQDLFVMGCVSCPDSIHMLRNDSGNFVRINIPGLPAQLGSGGSAWGDYDNDGDPDLLLYGSTLNGSPYNPVTRVYQNNNGTLTDINVGLTGVLQADADWIDYDNDGDLDISLLGRIGASGQVFRLYKNTSGVFTQDTTLVPAFWWSSMDWGDYDNDGDYDLGVAGDYVVNSVNNWVTTIYTNENGHLIPTGLNLLPMGNNGVFRWVDVDNDGDLDISVMGEQPSAVNVNKIFINNYGIFTATNPGFRQENFCFSDWIDFDNDGDADLLQSTGHVNLTNAHNTIYRNDGSGSFSIVNDNIIQYLGSVQWVDYDGDGDADFLCMDSSQNFVLYRNTLLSDAFMTSVPPGPPAALTSTVNGNTVSFTWTAGADAQTPAPALTYNLLVRKLNDTVNIATSLADTVSGRRMTWRAGNSGYNLTHTLYNLDTGTYVAKIQSLDIQHYGSAFTNVTAFTITTPLIPTLILPHDSAHTAVNVSFQWIAFPNATGYHIECAYDSLFTSLVLNDSLLSVTTRLANGLPPDTLLFWRVRAATGNSWSAWSARRNFHTHRLFTAPFLQPPVCPYDSTTISVSYSTSVTLQAGNVFHAELSDASGSFSNPVIIGSLSSTQSSGTFAAVIPPAMLPGTNYLIRITASQPSMVGTNNGSAFTVYPSSATASVIAADTILCAGNIDTLSFSGSGFISFIWSTGETTPQITTGTSGLYGLSVTDNNGCQLTVDRMILFENCSLVWPGDADEDLTVTTADLLPIGVHYNLTGYARDTTTISWAGHEALDWPVIQLNGVNTKFIDCNGDGIVLSDDTNAIVANFNNTHIARIHQPAYAQLNAPAYLSSSSNQYAPGSFVTVYVNIGSITDPAVHVYGGDVRLSLPSSAFLPGSAQRSYVPSWLGAAYTDLLAVSDFGLQQQTLDFSLVRFDHTSRSGYGQVAAVSFILDSTLLQGDSLAITIDNAFIIDSTGQRSNLAISGFVIHIDTSASPVEAFPLSDASVSVYPNPFSSKLTVNVISAGPASMSYSWFDLGGRKIGLTQEVNLTRGANQFNADLPASMEKGIYFLELKCRNTDYHIKVIKM